MRGWGKVRRRADGYQVDICLEGRRVRISYPSAELAAEALKELRRQRALGRIGARLPGDDRLTYADAIDGEGGFREHIRGRGLRPRTLEAYLLELNAVVAYWGSREVARTRIRDVEAWTREMQKDGLAPSTIRHRLDRLSQTHRWLVDTERLPDEPCPVRRPRLTVERRQVVSEDELAAVVERAGTHRDRRPLAAVLLAADAGLRVSEIVALRQEDVGREWLTVRSGKGGRERRVPILTARLRDALAALTDDPLFGAKTRDGLYRFVRPVWPQPEFHGLRHRFATLALSVPEVAPDDVRQWLGHGHLRTTAIYTHERQATPPPELGAALESTGRDGRAEKARDGHGSTGPRSVTDASRWKHGVEG